MATESPFSVANFFGVFSEVKDVFTEQEIL